MSAYSDRVIADGATNYWRLNEPSGTTAVDSVGGANGTISGGVTLAQPGATVDGDKAMVFNGSTGQIVTAAAVAIPLTVTIEAWARLTGGASHRAIVSDRGSGTHPLMLGVDPGGVWVCYSDTATPIAVGTSSSAVVGAWTHVVMVHTGTSCAFYLDGVLVRTVAQTRGGTPVAGSVGIGAGPDGANRWTGSLDDIAIYPRALTAPEIAAHYTVATAAGRPLSFGWWKQGCAA